MKNLYVLLAGIDDYAPHAPNLKGCIKDVRRIEKFLKKHYSKSHQLNILRLEDGQATYSGIINGFRSHLGQAKEGDVVWFHFSGHGSEEKTAKEFLTLEPNGKDQTLNCYAKGDDTQEYLADKELAVLLNEVATNHAGVPPHIVVSLDCCHSGSGTRSAGDDMVIGTRNAPSRGKERTLDSYVDGYFSKIQGQLQVPSAPHVLLSACESVQRAGDLPQGGAFTTGLVKALDKTDGDISYADLFMRTRTSVKKIKHNQTPQFETLVNFNPYTRFLDGSPKGRRDEYEVIEKGSDWYVKCGAIHGLPTTNNPPVKLDLFSPDGDEKGTATIKSVGAQLSRIDFESGMLQNIWRDVMNTELRAVIRKFPAPKEMVFLEGEDEGLALLKDETRWDATKNVLWTEDVDESHSIRAEACDGIFTVKDLDQSRTAFRTRGLSAGDADTVIDALDKVVHLRRFLKLKNRDPRSRMQDMARFEVEVYDKDGNETIYRESEIILYATHENSDNGKFTFNPIVRLANVDQILYFYLFFIAFDYSIECPGEEIVYRPGEYDDLSDIKIPLWKKTLAWRPPDHQARETCTFKLLVTTEPLDHHQFTQSSLGVHRSVLEESSPKKVFNDWTCITMPVTIVIQEQSVGPDADTVLADGNLTIKAHKSISASISIDSADPGTRSGDSSGAFAALQLAGKELVDFSSTRSQSSQNVIELRDIKMSDADALQNDPLQLVVRHAQTHGGSIVPIAFDGEYFQVIGDAQDSDDGLVVNVRDVPDMSVDSSGMGERSLLRSLKFTLFKVAFDQEDLNELKWIDHQEDGTLQFRKDSLGIKLSKAKRILLIIHGLGSDCRPIAEGLFTRQAETLTGDYDLVLTYDYESLNTPIDQTAKALNDTLIQFGFGAGSEKKIVVLAHSIGGLVARQVVEKLGGTTFVERLILVGTPHNGSMYGKIGDYRKWAKLAMNLAINFIPGSVPFAGFIQKALGVAKDLSGSIEQLNPEGTFINALNSGADPGVPYTVIGGDASLVDSAAVGLNKYLKTLGKQASTLSGKGEVNDLFAPLSSTQCAELWEGRAPAVDVKPTARAHHFGYFAMDSATRSTNNGIWEHLGAALKK